ncbi:hypothetical protein [Flavivirga eckloniae]|uniref:Uncharacterized protein n=1 Tax=Flavivirga eckloniae TaxID=1803846 RepID=A0A2K9PK72_9FLAO|nr:hypothetical protein [Flavivirga eckloniae]AUP77426.1 hypothetical protein C1H87_01300 [Flavivirga eckloniae]
MEGNYSGYSAGLGVSGEYQWSNEDNARGELYPGQKSTTSWETNTVGSGYGGGEVGAKIFWGKSKILKQLN